ncbi:MAG: septum site-determining protein MinC [Beijerinckiaceae bacterium]|jgi:septum site-determining protein MinC
MTVTDATAIRFRGRSYFALTLTPEAPIEAWLARLDACLARSPAFFGASPVILDLDGLSLTRAAAVALVGEVKRRGLRILGLDGALADWDAPESDADDSAFKGGAVEDLPPRLAGGREAAGAQTSQHTNQKACDQAQEAPCGLGVRAPMIVDAPVRSGQRIVNPEGDVIVIGSVGSGAEIVAAGSIHVYGALRGRAMAGAYGDEGARIFCRRLDAELIAINGLYQTAEDIEPRLRRQSVQIRLADGAMRVTPFD